MGCRRRRGGVRREGVQGADVDAEGRTCCRDPHLACSIEETQIDDRDNIDEVCADLSGEPFAPGATDHAALGLQVSHHWQTHGQQDQRNAGNNRKHGTISGSH